MQILQAAIVSAMSDTKELYTVTAVLLRRLMPRSINSALKR